MTEATVSEFTDLSDDEIRVLRASLSHFMGWMQGPPELAQVGNPLYRRLTECLERRMDPGYD